MFSQSLKKILGICRYIALHCGRGAFLILKRCKKYMSFWVSLSILMIFQSEALSILIHCRPVNLNNNNFALFDSKWTTVHGFPVWYWMIQLKLWKDASARKIVIFYALLKDISLKDMVEKIVSLKSILGKSHG